uniref:Protein kinase putative n=1 Tax=Albugo laibachii Nc14 TaxID=890382 RepID=F0WXU7_9STRA|nr:protein kinase putative [Albugo laibachii Nc14]|eukprot:CCA26295.1 protein kinase putative [Albugo laibachii Nc14]
MFTANLFLLVLIGYKGFKYSNCAIQILGKYRQDLMVSSGEVPLPLERSVVQMKKVSDKDVVYKCSEATGKSRNERNKENSHVGIDFVKTSEPILHTKNAEEEKLKSHKPARTLPESDRNVQTHAEQKANSAANRVPERIVEHISNRSSTDTERVYVRGRFLGKGGFARCYELKCEETKEVHAGKVVNKTTLLKAKAKQKFASEIKIHRSLKHNHIVQFKHYFEDAQNAYILLELCRNQSLSELLRRRKRLSEPEVRYYVRQLVQGLEYLHTKLIIHRDLKLGNLFLTEDMQLKIGDFGLAARLDDVEDRKRTMCGTPNYIAPEILTGQRGDGHSFEVDIWSMGVVIYTLLIGKPPFETSDVKDTYRRIRSNQYTFPSDVPISCEAKSLVTSILQTDPQSRPPLEEIMAHPFFQHDLIPDSLPRTALLITPTKCKLSMTSSKACGEGSSRQSNTISSSGSSTRSNGPTKSVTQRSSERCAQPRPPRYALRSRDINTNPDIEVNERYVQFEVAATEQQDNSSSPKPPPSPSRDICMNKERQPDHQPEREPSVKCSRHDSDDEMTEIAEDGHYQEDIYTEPNPATVLQQALETLESLFSMYQTRQEAEKSKASDKSAIVAEAPILGELEMKKSTQSEQEAVVAPLWITQWVDYTTKYGLGYILSNGSAGVYFNDSTRIITSTDAQFFDYFERSNSKGPETTRIRCLLSGYSSSLAKKATLLTHFQSYLLDSRAKDSELLQLESELVRHQVSLCRSKRIGSTSAGSIEHSKILSAKEPYLPIIQKWFKAKHAILFVLSNQTFQVNFYECSKLIFSQNGRIVSYLDKNGRLEIYELASVLTLPEERSDLIKRLRYVKDMMEQLVKPK